MASLPYFIRGLRSDYDGSDLSYYRTFQNTADGKPAKVTYGFMDEPERGDMLTDAEAASFRPYTEAEKNAVRMAVAEFEAVCGVDFREVGHVDGDLRLGLFDIEGAGGWAMYPITDPDTGDRYFTQPVMVHADYDFSPTGYGYYVILHELGHALGLKHSHEGTDALPADEDDSGRTVMSYDIDWNGGGEYHLRTYDIIALQSVYGPAKARLGANTYMFGDDKIIWDGGGKDAISARHLAEDVRLDLNGGTWNWIGSKSAGILDERQVWLGHFTRIESAYGGRGNDTLLGNELANTLRGGAGNDVLSGRGGNDLLVGEAGKDILTGSSGKDRIYGKEGNDTISGGSGIDVMSGGTGRDVFRFEKMSVMGSSASHDTITDFGGTDCIDLSTLDADHTRSGRQKAKFLGNADGDHVFGIGKAGTFYFNKASHDLVFDANGDGTGDYAITLSKVDAMKSWHFIL